MLVFVLQQIRRGWWKQLWHVYEELCLEMHVVCKGISAFDQGLLFPWCNCGNLKIVGKKRDCVRKLMWWFSFILDFTKGKRLPFFGNIPYAQSPKGVALFFLLLRAVSFYHRKILLLCPLPLMKYCSSFLFSLLRFRFLQGQVFHAQLRASQKGSLFPLGGFSVLLRSRCADTVLL